MITNEVSIPCIGARGALLALDGRERLGGLFRFAITFACHDGTLDLDNSVGGAAQLTVADQTLHGILAEIEQGEVLEDGDFVYRAVLVPSLWLLSLGRRSRTFSSLSTPNVVNAVLSSTGLATTVEAHLSAAYPRQPSIVQHRESDLDFVQRLLEREGMTMRCHDDGQRPRVVLCDHNQALASGARLTMGRDLHELRCKSRAIPRAVELSHHDPARPHLPLRARAHVAARGFGELDVDDVAFASPEDGQRVAQLYAERSRCTAKQFTGVAQAMLRAGERTSIAGHPRADFNTELVIIDVHHELHAGGDGYRCAFTAIPSDVPFRPERATPEPKIFGLMGGRVALRDPGSATAQSDDGRYRVQALDGSAGERAMPLATPYGSDGVNVALREGAHVVWGCLDGDPDRPIITAALPEAGFVPSRHARIRGRSGATIEISGMSAEELGVVEGQLDGPIPQVAHYGTSDTLDVAEASGVTTDLAYTDTWMRFGVPHSDPETTKPWSYLRIGEAATETALSTTNAGSFNENASDCIALELNSYTATGVAGIFQFTNKNKTALTKGQNEEIIKGESLVSIYGGGTTKLYEHKVDADKVSTSAKTDAYEWAGNTKLEGIAGFKMENIFGGKFETLIGGKLGAELGFMGTLTAGYMVDFVYADRLEISKGEELGSASTIDRRAEDRIQYSLYKGTASVNWETMAAATLAVGTTALLAWDPADLDPGVKAALYGGFVGVAVVIARALSKERDLVDGDPILSLTKDAAGKKYAVLRADDWWQVLNPDFAMMGKNKSYGAPDLLIAADDFDLDDTKTAIVLEEGSKIRIQASTTGTAAEITFNDKLITVDADTVRIAKVGGGDAAVTITGTLNVTGNVTFDSDLAVTGKTDVTGALTAGGKAVQVQG